jgi:hypothetical protein
MLLGFLVRRALPRSLDDFQDKPIILYIYLFRCNLMIKNDLDLFKVTLTLKESMLWIAKEQITNALIRREDHEYH